MKQQQQDMMINERRSSNRGVYYEQLVYESLPVQFYELDGTETLFMIDLLRASVKFGRSNLSFSGSHFACTWIFWACFRMNFAGHGRIILGLRRILAIT